MEEHSIDAVDGLPVGSIVFDRSPSERSLSTFCNSIIGSPPVGRLNLPESFHIFKRLFIVAYILSENTRRVQFSLGFLIR